MQPIGDCDLVRTDHLGADLVGVGMIQVVEDRQRLLSAILCLQLLASGEVGVAEVGQDRGFVVTGAGLSEDAERALVGGGRYGRSASSARPSASV
jgi:hypothetical protein